VPSRTPFPDAPAVADADDCIPELPADEVTFFSKDETDVLAVISNLTRLTEEGLGSGDSIVVSRLWL
jgi:hypothetical protein